MVSHAPITTKTRKNFDASSVEGIKCVALDANNIMCESDPFSGKYISLCLMYRGTDCKPDECHKAVTKVFLMSFITIKLYRIAINSCSLH